MPRHDKAQKVPNLGPFSRITDATDIAGELVQADDESRQKIEEYLKLANNALRTNPSPGQVERSKRTA